MITRTAWSDKIYACTLYTHQRTAKNVLSRLRIRDDWIWLKKDVERSAVPDF